MSNFENVDFGAKYPILKFDHFRVWEGKLTFVIINIIEGMTCFQLLIVLLLLPLRPLGIASYLIQSKVVIYIAAFSSAWAILGSGLAERKCRTIVYLIHSKVVIYIAAFSSAWAVLGSGLAERKCRTIVYLMEDKRCAIINSS